MGRAIQQANSAWNWEAALQGVTEEPVAARCPRTSRRRGDHRQVPVGSPIDHQSPSPVVLVNAKLGCHDLALKTVGTAQNNPATLRERTGHPVPPHLSFDIRTLVRRQHQRLNRTTLPKRARHKRLPLGMRFLQCHLLQFQMTSLKDAYSRNEFTWSGLANVKCGGPCQNYNDRYCVLTEVPSSISMSSGDISPP